MDNARYERREQCQQFFDSIDETVIDGLNLRFPEYALKLTEFLILSILDDDVVSVGYISGIDQASTVTFNITIRIKCLP